MTPTTKLNARAWNAEVMAWPDGRGAKVYMARTQAEAARAKLADAERFDVWQPMAGRCFYVRKITS